MPASGSPTARQRRLAAELRRLRERTGKTGDEVAEALGWSPSKVSRYELARTSPNPAEVQKLLDIYEVTGTHREQLQALAQEATQKGWWEAYSDALPEELIALIALEDEATSLRIWQVEVVPGLLQTETYARQLLRDYQSHLDPTLRPSLIGRRVEARHRHQQILTRDRPVELSVVLDESALLRHLADKDAMRSQLEHLIEISRLPNVRLQIFPLERRYPVITASFELLEFGRAFETTLHDVVSTEHLQSTLYFEGEADTHQYRLAFTALARAALDPEQSRELISATAGRADGVGAGI